MERQSSTFCILWFGVNSETDKICAGRFPSAQYFGYVHRGRQRGRKQNKIVRGINTGNRIISAAKSTVENVSAGRIVDGLAPLQRKFEKYNIFTKNL